MSLTSYAGIVLRGVIDELLLFNVVIEPCGRPERDDTEHRALFCSPDNSQPRVTLLASNMLPFRGDSNSKWARLR